MPTFPIALLEPDNELDAASADLKSFKVEAVCVNPGLDNTFNQLISLCHGDFSTPGPRMIHIPGTPERRVPHAIVCCNQYNDKFFHEIKKALASSEPWIVVFQYIRPGGAKDTTSDTAEDHVKAMETQLQAFVDSGALKA